MPGAEHAALDAFLALVERRALRIAQLATRDRDQALDLVQDAMFQLARRYAARPPAEWPPLFYRCLQNRVRDWQRRESVWRRVFFTWDDAPLDDGTREDALAQLPDRTTGDGLAHVQRDQAMTRLEAALRRLPGRQREAFELRVWEGLDVRDTALAMACGEGSVKTHLSRALASLRRDLEGVWP